MKHQNQDLVNQKIKLKSQTKKQLKNSPRYLKQRKQWKNQNISQNVYVKQ